MIKQGKSPSSLLCVNKRDAFVLKTGLDLKEGHLKQKLGLKGKIRPRSRCYT